MYLSDTNVFVGYYNDKLHLSGNISSNGLKFCTFFRALKQYLNACDVLRIFFFFLE